MGTGLGKLVGGVLSVALGMGAALSISAAMWVPCALLLLAISYIFSGDIKKMQEKLRSAVSEMTVAPK